MADGGHIEFRKNANKYIRLLYEDICTQFRTKMQHGADYGQQNARRLSVVENVATTTTSSYKIRYQISDTLFHDNKGNTVEAILVPPSMLMLSICARGYLEQYTLP